MMIGMSPLYLVLAVLFLVCTTGRAHADLLSPEDQQAYRIAFAAARVSDWTTARQAAERTKERLPGKVLHWLELTRNTMSSFSDLVAFADANPDWPLMSTLRERAEDVAKDVPDAILLPYFQKNAPTTPPGKLRLADMLMVMGQGEPAVALIRATWLAPDLDPDTEKAILERYAHSLRPEDHAARLDRLIWEGLEGAARRMLPLVAEDHRLLGEARLALAGQQAEADSLVARLPRRLDGDPGLLFERARSDRRRGRLEEAAEIMTVVPDYLGRPAAWWTERQILARHLIEAGKDGLAYAVVSPSGPSERGMEFADAEFLSGWIALRRLADPKTAAEHFARLYHAAKLPVSLARAAYWTGLAAESLGMKDEARRWLMAAAEQGTTYYGQLASARLGMATEPRFPADPTPGAEDIAAFEANELTRATRLMAEIGESETAKPFLLRLSAATKSPSRQKLIAALAESMARFDVAIVAAKRAGTEGVPLLASGFPVIPVEHGAAEKPLVLAITRQESGFDVAAVSRSDARGLMQLKPSTAKQLAKSLSLAFSADRLLTDASYNLTLGSAYLDRMIDRFGGSYVLSIAAYNAGPARVAQWLSAYGDPRGGAIDVVDWIELIPFGETRNYVQRVLENLQVYRLRLGDAEHAFKLAQDLKR